MSNILDLSRPYRMIGDPPHDWAIQNGRIFHWSESNYQYEVAWWLDDDGTPIIAKSDLVKNIQKDRPFDPEWLRE